MAEIVQHADGVFLNLAAERYRADWAIGSDALKTIATSPLSWWWQSIFNTIEPPEMDDDQVAEAKHFRLGTATHVALLEGTNGSLDTYDACYGIEPDRDSDPDALRTVAQLQVELEKRGLRTSGNKPELIDRLAKADPTVKILKLTQEEFALSGLRGVSAAEDRRIRLLHAMLHASQDHFKLPDGDEQTLSEAFIGGLSEVSVFWTDEMGIRQRARFDKLKPRVTIDLKTFANWKRSMDFDRSLLVEAKNRKYPLQAAHYEEGRVQLRRLVAEGKVFGGTPAQRALLERIAASDDWAWLWAFAVTKGYPHLKGIRHDLGGIVHGNAVRDREDALAAFSFYMNKFGLEQGRMWLDPVPIWEPTDESWPF